MNNGIADTSISDITTHAGVGKGTFYLFFKDKDDLIQKLIAQKGEQLFMHSLDELKKQDEMSVEDTIIFIADDLIEQLKNDSKLLKFINKSLTHGFYKRALNADGLHNSDFDFLSYYYEIIEKDGKKIKENVGFIDKDDLKEIIDSL